MNLIFSQQKLEQQVSVVQGWQKREKPFKKMTKSKQGKYKNVRLFRGDQSESFHTQKGCAEGGLLSRGGLTKQVKTSLKIIIRCF